MVPASFSIAHTHTQPPEGRLGGGDACKRGGGGRASALGDVPPYEMLTLRTGGLTGGLAGAVSGAAANGDANKVSFGI
jgi:hypothetical protein